MWTECGASDYHRFISRSPTDVQPLFDIIGARAEKLCDAEVSLVSRVDGELIQLAAIHAVNQEGTEAVRGVFPIRLDAETVTARTVRNRAIVHIENVLAGRPRRRRGWLRRID